jgi:hypothetical protein
LHNHIKFSQPCFANRGILAPFAIRQQAVGRCTPKKGANLSIPVSGYTATNACHEKAATADYRGRTRWSG